MDSNSFINHKDPTLPLDIDISENEIAKLKYDTLTYDEKMMVGAKLLGLNHVPVDILTFICDDYFLGLPSITNYGKGIYQYWKDELPKIFPNPLTTTTPYISFGGATGIGEINCRL